MVPNWLSHNEFVARAVARHGGRYSYSEEYRGSREVLTVTCHWHGDFKIRASRHLAGQGCPSCGPLSQGATRQGVTLEVYLRAQNEGKRYCKVHGLQYIREYQVTSGKGGKAPTQHCKKCEAASRKKHKKTINAGVKRRNQRHRLDVLRHYSPELRCAICGEDHLEFLALDHIHGGGTQKRKAARVTGGYGYWTSIKRAGYPDGFRVLCHNCNLKHGCRDFYWKGERRKADVDLSQHHLTVAVRRFNERHPDRSREQARRSHQKRKAEVLAHYGGSCACCGAVDLDVLSIDHINKDGAAHRRELKARGETFGYHWLKKNGFPAGFRVLCLNCNFARGFYGYCPHERKRSDTTPWSNSEGSTAD